MYVVAGLEKEAPWWGFKLENSSAREEFQNVFDGPDLGEA